jgi:hypothetical protein
MPNTTCIFRVIDLKSNHFNTHIAALKKNYPDDIVYHKKVQRSGMAFQS